MNLEQNIMQIPIEDIIPNRFQPRLNFDEKGLEELANSIKQHGIIQPLVVRRLGDKFEIIAGERRYKAATIAGLKNVPAIIAQIDDNKSAEVAIVENIQRRDLSPIEEARSYKNILDKGYTQSELAKKLGVSQSAIANKLRLLNLDETVQEALMNNQISERHARSLLILSEPNEQRMWLEKIIRERMTVRELDDALKKALAKQREPDNKEYIEPDIPLVKPLDIEEIRRAATELPSVNENSELAQRIKEIEREKMYNPDVVPVEQATNNSQGNFFNFLESETVNMNMEENTLQTPVINLNNNQVAPPQNGNPDNNATSIGDANGIQNVTPVEAPKVENMESQPQNNSTVNIEALTPPQVSTPTFDAPPVVPQPNSSDSVNLTTHSEAFQNVNMGNTSLKIAKEPASLDMQSPIENKDFTPYETPRVEEITPTITPVNENIEQLDNFDPTSLIDTLDPTYEVKQEEVLGIDLKSAINEIRTVKDILTQKGFELTLEESDLPDAYQFVIKVKK